MKNQQKKVLLINDISCVGRCSLTVLHPFLSCAGFESVILPTSLLSNHTAYPSYSFLDLTNEMKIIVDNWRKLGIKFDAIISGYLGSENQIDLVKNIKNEFLNEDGIFIVDPVMGDNGKLYKGFNEDFPKKLRKLIEIADVITPNYTEACFLTDTPCQESNEHDHINEIFKKLHSLGAKTISITGIKSNNKIGVAFEFSNDIVYYFTKEIKGSIHGTGDVFLGALLGAYLNGKTYAYSNVLAAKFTYKSILKSLELKTDHLEGLPFEVGMKYYLNKIK